MEIPEEILAKRDKMRSLYDADVMYGVAWSLTLEQRLEFINILYEEIDKELDVHEQSRPH